MNPLICISKIGKTNLYWQNTDQWACLNEHGQKGTS